MNALPGVIFCAVVKANAYGHGTDQMVELLPSADWFAVHNLQEAASLCALGNTAYVPVRGKRALVLGRVCMNLTMIDVTDIPHTGLEDEVVLSGSSGQERISAETLAGWAGTINYEVVARISPLLERRVVNRD